MASYKKFVLTEKGQLLLNKVIAGECDLVVTKAATGDGEPEEGEDLKKWTALKSQRQVFGISSFSRMEDNICIRFVISNYNPGSGAGLEEEYRICEIGVFADDPEEGEILYAVSTADAGKGDFIPAYDETSPVTVMVNAYLVVGTGGNVLIRVSPDAYATAVDVAELRQRTGAAEDTIGKLQTVAFTGNYSDLSGRPVLQTVALTGKYNDLSGKPIVNGTISGSLTVDGNITTTGGAVNFKNADSRVRRTDLNNACGISMVAGDYGFVIYECMNTFLPTADGMNIGWNHDTGRIGNIFTKNGTLTGSDRHIKENIKALSGNDRYLELFDLIRMVTFTRKNKELTGKEVYQKSPNCRSHIGIIAQEVEDVLGDLGMTSNDFAGVTSDFCYNYGNFDGFMAGGYQVKAEGKDYSENTYDWKHREDKAREIQYEIFNEVIEKDIEDFKICDYRKRIQYIMIEDNSKLTKDQPPVTVRGIYFIDHTGGVQKIPLDGNTISYYEENDKDFADPLSEASYDKDEDTLTVNFKKMYGALFLEIPIMDLDQYEKVVLDVDYVSEYKVYLLSTPEKEGGYQNANVWDRARNDQILYDYTFNYNELFSLAAFALQETRREFKEYRESADNEVAALEDRIREMEERMVDSNE